MSPFETPYRLARSKSDVRWPSINESGAYLGVGTPLLRKRIPSSRPEWEPRSEAELNYLFSIGYDEPVVDSRGWRKSLFVVAKALNDGDISLAATALVLCRIPPLPSDDHARTMAWADKLEKFDTDEPRVPKGESGGGQWTTGDSGQPADRQNATHREGDVELEDVAYSPEALSIWPILRNALRQTSPSTELTWNVIREVLGNVSLSELPDDVKSALDPPKPFDELLPHKPFRCFGTWKALESYVGKAPAGYEWHHLIERSLVREHPEIPELVLFVENTDNIVLIPKLRHLMITAEMNTPPNRAFVHRHSLGIQYEIGKELLRVWGAML